MMRYKVRNVDVADSRSACWVKTAGKEGHKGPECREEICGEGRSLDLILGAIMEVTGKRLQGLPEGIGEIVISVEGSIKMPTFPVKAEPSGHLLRDPDIHKAAIANENTKFRSKGLDVSE